jgi:hypothetical protein
MQVFERRQWRPRCFARIAAERSDNLSGHRTTGDFPPPAHQSFEANHCVNRFSPASSNLTPSANPHSAGTYLGLRSIFWSLVRAKTDDDVASRLWSMAVGLEDGNISDAQAALRNAEEALRNALDRGASDQELKKLMDQLRAAMDRFMQATQEQAATRFAYCTCWNVSPRAS